MLLDTVPHHTICSAIHYIIFCILFNNLHGCLFKLVHWSILVTVIHFIFTVVFLNSVKIITFVFKVN